MVEKCPICGGNLITDTTDTGLINCEYCGKYNLECDFQKFGINKLKQKDKNILKHVFQILPENSQYRYKKFLSEYNLKEFLSIANAPSTIIDKINKVLGYYADKTETFGQKHEINPEKAARLHFCKDVKEFTDILKYLQDKKYIKYSNLDPTYNSKNITLTVLTEGLNYYEKSLLETTKQNQCFVAMWFNEEENLEKAEFDMSKIYTLAIEPAIKNNERNNKIKAVKINDLHFNDDIVDQIIAQIRRSKFVIADLTGNRGGVYFEAGFAEGLGLKVIYTCNPEWLVGNNTKKIPPVHFDINHKNIIEWDYDKLEDFKSALQNRINATIV